MTSDLVFIIHWIPAWHSELEILFFFLKWRPAQCFFYSSPQNMQIFLHTYGTSFHPHISKKKLAKTKRKQSEGKSRIYLKKT